MKIVVNRGRTVNLVVKPAVKREDGRYVPPARKAFGPTHLLDVPKEDAEFLIKNGFASKYDEPKQVEAAKPAAKDPEKTGDK